MPTRREASACSAVPFALRKLSGNAVKVWVSLDYYADWRSGRAPDATVPQVALDCELSQSTVERAIRELKQAGWLGTHEGGYILYARPRKPSQVTAPAVASEGARRGKVAPAPRLIYRDGVKKGLSAPKEPA